MWVIKVLVYGELLLHLDVSDALKERRSDGLVRHLWNLEENVGEALYIFVQGFTWLLLGAPQVACCRGAVASALEIGDEALTELVPGGDRPHQKV